MFFKNIKMEALDLWNNFPPSLPSHIHTQDFMGVTSQTQLEIKTGVGISPAGPREADHVLCDNKQRSQFTKRTLWILSTNRRSCATGIYETSKNLKNWTIFVCGKRNLCSSPFSTPPPCCLMVSCLQNWAADNVCGTSAQNRTLHVTGAGGRETRSVPQIKQVDVCAGCLMIPHLTKVSSTLTANTEALLLW